MEYFKLDTDLKHEEQAQAIFDHVVGALREQGGKCQGKYNNLCFYLDENNGWRCAVGHLIPEGAYELSMETKLADELIREFKAMFRFKPHLGLIEDLQTTHDLHDLRYWEERWRTGAKENNLTYTDPPQ